MSTGTEFVNVTSRRLIGQADFKERFLNHLRTGIQESFERSYRTGVVYDSAIALVAAGANRFSLSGSVKTTDGSGHLLEPFSDADFYQSLQFENALGIGYDVALRYAEAPSGVQVNPRTGLPEFISLKEVIGESGTPNSVINNGTNLTLVIDSVCETGVSNAGRKALVWLKTIAKDAITEAIAVEEVTVAWASGQNRITTSGLFGQATPSTTAADYGVILLGPTVRRNSSLLGVDGYCFIGEVTGAGSGSPPSSFDTSGQDVSDVSLSDLQDITSRNSSTDRLKVDVKSYAGDVNDPQIQVRNPSGTPVFTVDGNGNVVIQGTTTEHNVETIYSDETITGNLTAGDAASDSHLIKGTWRHTDAGGTANYFRVDGATGRIGINRTPESTATEGLLAQASVDGNVRIVGEAGAGLRVQSASPALQLRETDRSINTDGLWRWVLTNGEPTLQANTAAAGDFSSIDTVFWYDQTESAFQTRSLYPTATNLRDLGRAGLEWRDLYVDRYAYIDELILGTATGEGLGSDMLPDSDSVRDLGSVSRRYAEVHSRKLFLDNTAGYGAGSDIIPTADNSYSLGSASRRWANLFTYNLSFTGNFLPTTDDAQDLGSALFEWRDLFIDGIAYIDTLSLDTTDGLGVASTIKPTASGTYDLGSSTREWRDLWITGTANIDTLSLSTTAGEGIATDFLPTANASWDLGSTTYRFANAYSTAIQAYYFAPWNIADGYGCQNHWKPTSDGLYDLGSAGREWRDLFIDGTAYLDILSLSEAAGEGVSSSLLPSSTGTYDLGSSTYAWRNLYVSDLITIGSAPTFGESVNLRPYKENIDISNVAMIQMMPHYRYTSAPSTATVMYGATIRPRWELDYEGGSFPNVTGLYLDPNFGLSGNTTPISVTYAMGVDIRTGWATTAVNINTVYGLRVTDGASSGTLCTNWYGVIVQQPDGASNANYGVTVTSMNGTSGASNTAFYVSSVTGTGGSFNAGLEIGNVSGATNNYAIKTASGLVYFGDSVDARSILPNADNSYDLGSSSYQWRDLFVNGTAEIDILNLSINSGEGMGNHLVPAYTTLDLGTSGQQWRDLYLDGTANLDLLNLSSAAGEGLSNHLVPSSNNSTDLGNATYQFRDLYIDGTANLDAIAGCATAAITAITGCSTASITTLTPGTALGNGCAGHWYPSADDTYDLGGSYQWRNLNLDGVAYIDTLSLSTAAGEGFSADLIPTTNVQRNIGSTSYRCLRFYGWGASFDTAGSTTGDCVTIIRNPITYTSTDLYGLRVQLGTSTAMIQNYDGIAVHGYVYGLGRATYVCYYYGGRFLAYSDTVAGANRVYGVSAIGTYGQYVYGIYAEATGGSYRNYGVYAYANTSATANYCLYATGGTKSWENPHPIDPTKSIVYSTVESERDTALTRGRGSLVNGQATITFPEHFACTASELETEDVHVIVTPRDASSKGLAVTQSDNEGFTVVELESGTGSYDFDYVVTARRRGFEEGREIIQDNIDWIPGLGNLGEWRKTSQEFYDDTSPGLKRILKTSGMLLADGSINQPLFAANNWPILT